MDWTTSEDQELEGIETFNVKLSRVVEGIKREIPILRERIKKEKKCKACQDCQAMGSWMSPISDL